MCFLSWMDGFALKSDGVQDQPRFPEFYCKGLESLLSLLGFIIILLTQTSPSHLT